MITGHDNTVVCYPPGALAETRRHNQVLEQQVRDNAILDRRAWISDVNVRGVFQWRVPFTPSIHMTNTGRTPAYDARFWISMQTFPTGQLSKLVLPPSNGPARTVASGEIIERRYASNQGQPINFATYRAVSSGQLTLYVFGRLDYGDQYQAHHWVTFCSMYAPQAKEFYSCDYGNDVDRNPK